MKLELERIDITIAKKALLFSNTEFIEYNKNVDEEFKKLVTLSMQKLLTKHFSIKEDFYNLSMQQQDNIAHAPEILRLLFNPKEILKKKLNHFLSMAIEAEKGKITGEFDFEKYGNILWTIDGSFMISYSSENNEFVTYKHPTISNTKIPQDYFSYFNLMNSLDENHYEISGSNPSLHTFEESIMLTENVNKVFDKLSNSYKEFINLFINVLMLKKINDDKYFFKSVTDNTHINRVIICNGHTVSDEILVEALIHEATHGLLTIIDVFNKWQPSNQKSDHFGRKIHSPWTNNLLTIRNLVQGIYVWYGLYNFWNSKPLNFNQEYAKERAIFIKKGFLNLDINLYKEMLSPLTFSELSSIKNKFI